MSYIETISPEKAHGEAKKIYDVIRKSSQGAVPNILRVLSLRPDLMALIATLHQRLMWVKRRPNS